MLYRASSFYVSLCNILQPRPLDYSLLAIVGFQIYINAVFVDNASLMLNVDYLLVHSVLTI